MSTWYRPGHGRGTHVEATNFPQTQTKRNEYSIRMQELKKKKQFHTIRSILSILYLSNLVCDTSSRSTMGQFVARFVIASSYRGTERRLSTTSVFSPEATTTMQLFLARVLPWDSLAGRQRNFDPAIRGWKRSIVPILVPAPHTIPASCLVGPRLGISLVWLS